MIRLAPRRVLLSALLLVLLAALAASGDNPQVQDLARILAEQAKEPFGQDKRKAAIRKLGRIGGVDAAAALLPLFEDPFVHLRDHAVSAWIAMLQGLAGPETRNFLASRALGDRSPEVRRGAALALGAVCGREIQDPLRLAISKEREPAVLGALADADARLREKPDLRGALLARLDTRDGHAALHVALAAAAVDGGAAVPALERLLKHREPLARAGAVLALQTLDALPEQALDTIVADAEPAPPIALAETLALRTRTLPWPTRGRPVLERLLAHPSWRVRAAAVQGALRVWDNAIVEPLIARLDREAGRIQDDVRRALETYTGQSAHGVDAELWTAWWRARGADFTPAGQPSPDGAGNVVFRGGDATHVRPGTTTVAFYDMPLRSKRFAFVFDLSGSMGSPARKGATEGRTKLDILKAEIGNTLRALPEDTHFDLFVYRFASSFPPKTQLTRALGKFQPCTKQNVRKALAWLDKQEAKGWGAFYEPLEALLEEDVDSAVLLSDGSPSRGRYDRDVRILTEYPRANRFRRLAINTVLVGTKGADRTFMEELAAATGGRFRAAAGE